MMRASLGAVVLLSLAFLLSPSLAARRLALSISRTAPLRVQRIRPSSGSSAGRGFATAQSVKLSSFGVAPNTTSTSTSTSTNTSSSTSTSTSSSASAANGGKTGFQSWPGVSGQVGSLEYQGGKILTNPINVHFIYYGDWGPNSGLSVLPGFVESLDTPTEGENPSVYNWWRISTRYTDSSGKTVSPTLKVGKTITINRNYRTYVDDGITSNNNDILNLVAHLIQRGSLPLDEGAFYAVIVSGDISVGDSETGFCGSRGYCGWHSQAAVDGTPIQFAFIGDGTQRCNTGCGQNDDQRRTPNGHFAMDSLVSTFAHELTEAATNPDAATGYIAKEENSDAFWENADLCNGQVTDDDHPTLLYTSQNAAYNLEGMNGLKFLVQTNVDLPSQSCVLQSSSSAAIANASPPDAAPDLSAGPSSSDSRGLVPGNTSPLGTSLPPDSGSAAPPTLFTPSFSLPPESAQPPAAGGTVPDGGILAPPTGGIVPPPGGGGVAPPTGGDLAPPTGGDLAPPTGGDLAPPTGGDLAPPTGVVGVPPTGGTLTPFPTGGTLPPEGSFLPPEGSGLPPTDIGGTVPEGVPPSSVSAPPPKSDCHGPRDGDWQDYGNGSGSYRHGRDNDSEGESRGGDWSTLVRP